MSSYTYYRCLDFPVLYTADTMVLNISVHSKEPTIDLFMENSVRTGGFNVFVEI